MYGEILQSYSQMFKTGFLAAVLLAIVSYGTYLRWQVWSYEQEVRSLKATIVTFSEEKQQLESALKTQQDIIRSLDNYYKERKPLNLHDGELSPDEILPSSKERLRE